MAERYEIKSKIGQGGVGAVYRAFDHQLNRIVAIKRLLPPEESELDETPDELLTKEATLMSSLSHPNIISVYDAGVDADGAFVVMEFIDGETLDETIRRAALTEDDFITLAEQCLDGLMAAQGVGMLHRDIKPSNIMVRWLPTGRFQIKIVDFGLAKMSFKPTIQTIDHGDAILGSIYFLAPEQFERRPLDKRTDLYALGCVFYYALTQSYPFRGDTAADVMMAHLEHRLTPLEELRPDLSPSILRWVEDLYSRGMDERPDDAGMAINELGVAMRARTGGVASARPVEVVEDADAARDVITIPDTAVPPSPAGPPPDVPTNTSRLITSTHLTSNSKRKLITGAVPTASTGLIRQGSSGATPLTTTSRRTELPGDPDESARGFFRILLFAIPILLLLFFGLSRCTGGVNGAKEGVSGGGVKSKGGRLKQAAAVDAFAGSLLFSVEANEASTRIQNENSKDKDALGVVGEPIAGWVADNDRMALVSLELPNRPELASALRLSRVAEGRNVLRFEEGDHMHIENPGSQKKKHFFIGRSFVGLTIGIVARVESGGRLVTVEMAGDNSGSLTLEHGKSGLRFSHQYGKMKGGAHTFVSGPSKDWRAIVASFNSSNGAVQILSLDESGALEVSPIEFSQQPGLFTPSGFRVGYREPVGKANKHIDALHLKGDIAAVRLYGRSMDEEELTTLVEDLGRLWWQAQ